jgi:DNA repair exonuclease SbcCD ATPase subunit
MATEPIRPTTLVQYKAALARAEAAQQALTQELTTQRKTNTQLSADLQATKLLASRHQEQFNALQQSSQADLNKLRTQIAALEKQLQQAQQAATQAQADTAKAQTQAAQAQADKLAVEAKAGQQLAEASELLKRQKLAAVAAADRELKLNAEIAALRQQLAQAGTTGTVGTTGTGTVSVSPPATGDDPHARLRQQVDALVAENRRLAESRDQLLHDQATLAATIQGQQLAQTQAVDKARSETQQAARLEIDRLKESSRLGQARLASLTAQLQSAGKLEVLAPEQVGALMGGFLQQLEGGMPTLRLSEGELKLKLGLASAGPTQGFVILQPGAQVDAQATVHEVALKFDRSGGLNLPTLK